MKGGWRRVVAVPYQWERGERLSVIQDEVVTTGSEQHGLWNVTAPTGFPAPLLGNLGTGWLSVLFNKIRIKTTASLDGTVAKTLLRVLLRPY